MTLPDERYRSIKMTECFLHQLGLHGTVIHKRLLVIKLIPYFAFACQRPAGGEVSSALQEDHKLFLADAANLPEKVNGSQTYARITDDAVAAATHQIAHSVSGNLSTTSKHTYGFKSGKQSIQSI